MKKKIIILWCILSSICTIAEAQTFSSEDEQQLLEKIESYRDDQSTQHIKELIRLYSTGTAPDQKVINSNYAGIVYVLNDHENRFQSKPYQTIIAPAMWLGTPNSVKVQGIRRRESVGDGSDNEYVKLYNQNQSLAETGEGRYILSSIRDMANGTLRGFSPHEITKEECVIDDIFARMNGDNLIAISSMGDMDVVMIHSFKLSNQKQILALSQAMPQAARNTLDEYRAKEKDRNSFSEMIETIINHPEVAMYYHDREMYILSNGLFRNDLEIKYQDKDVLILPSQLEGLKNYIVFTSTNYDGEEDHPVTFLFNIPEEGIYGVAKFQAKNGKWELKELSMMEN